MQNKDPKQSLSELTLAELENLAQEIRTQILEVLSINGGHLSSNLGVVELTIALHRVFQSPMDRLIFDVSHQTYPHKILTGRKELFAKLRKHRGLCGFAHPKESEHDHFYAGHAGTALSLALGMAKARDLSQGKEYILPILGDASLTCGLTLEALNNVPKNLTRFIAILNDNAMSISQNVGNIKSILSRLLNNCFANRIYQEIAQLLSKIPTYGPSLEKLSHKISESLKNLVSPALFFEQFNLSYIGPIDGHDLGMLISSLESAKEAKTATLIHVLTTKGKGMPIAIANPTPYHGVRPFDLCSGKFLPSKSKKMTFPKIFGRHLLEMAKEHRHILCITPAMPAGSCLEELMQYDPERCIDVGIAEGHAVTFAGGIAKDRTKKVFVCIYATFFQRALDNLFHDVCLQELPVVFALDRAFLSGPDGTTHHGIYDISFLYAMPNLILAQPRDGQVLKELLESSLSWNAPSAIRYPNLETEEDLFLPLQPRPIGKGEILILGKELLLLSLGHTYQTAFKVREHLLKMGIEATIVDPIFLKPLDQELLKTVFASHPFAATIEEHSVNAGLGMILNHFLVQHQIEGVKMLNFGIGDEWVQFGSNPELLEEMKLDPLSIAEKIEDSFFSSCLAGKRKAQIE